MKKLFHVYKGNRRFMINPHLTVINPRRKRNPLKYVGAIGKGQYEYDYVGEGETQYELESPKRKRKTRKKKGKNPMARRSSKAHMAYVRSFRKSGRNPRIKHARRRHARRNPYPVGGLVINPRRRRSAGKRIRMKQNRRRYHRNPLLPKSLFGISMPPIKQILFAGVGFIAPPMVEGFLTQYLPVSIQGSTIGKYAVRIGSVVALSFAAKKLVGAEEAKMVAIGGGAYILSTAVAEFAPGVIPGLSAYVDPGMGAYITATQPTYSQLGLPVAGGAAFGAGNTAIGGTAARFQRW